MKTVDFSETIAASDLKVSWSIHLIEYDQDGRHPHNMVKTLKKSSVPELAGRFP